VALSLGLKRPGREADHSPPFSAEVKECVELHLHSPDTPSWRGAQLKAQTTYFGDTNKFFPDRVPFSYAAKILEEFYEILLPFVASISAVSFPDTLFLRGVKLFQCFVTFLYSYATNT
jgi:hypothetical protein